MSKEKVLSSIRESGVVAVVRADDGLTAQKIVEACVAGGIKIIEPTFTVPRASELITALVKRYEATEVVVGAGTVTSADTAREALDCGARFVVTPYLDTDTVRVCVEAGVPVIPGIMTVREAAMAARAGADCLKLFPADMFGPQFIKALHGPMPEVEIMPTGGVRAEDIGEWIAAGAVAIGAGGALTAGARTGDYALITETARKFVNSVSDARKERLAKGWRVKG